VIRSGVRCKCKHESAYNRSCLNVVRDVYSNMHTLPIIFTEYTLQLMIVCRKGDHDTTVLNAQNILKMILEENYEALCR
jgi:hypothetical protein